MCEDLGPGIASEGGTANPRSASADAPGFKVVTGKCPRCELVVEIRSEGEMHLRFRAEAAEKENERLKAERDESQHVAYMRSVRIEQLEAALESALLGLRLAREREDGDTDESTGLILALNRRIANAETALAPKGNDLDV